MTMRKYKESFAAGATLQFEHPGGFFRVLRTAFPINVEFVRDFRPVDRADGIDSGMWYEPVQDFDSVRITNAGPRAADIEFLISRGRAGIEAPEVGLPTIIMETGVNPVTPGGLVPGWVSGDPAGLAASAQVNAIFDLGPHWDRYGLVAVTVNPAGPSSGFSAVQASGADTPSNYDNRRAMAYAFQGSGQSRMFATFNTVAAAGQVFLRPNGRFFTVNGTNADAANAMGAGAKFTVAAYPHS